MFTEKDIDMKDNDESQEIYILKIDSYKNGVELFLFISLGDNFVSECKSWGLSTSQINKLKKHNDIKFGSLNSRSVASLYVQEVRD
jgi:hypothetical protein